MVWISKWHVRGAHAAYAIIPFLFRRHKLGAYVEKSGMEMTLPSETSSQTKQRMLSAYYESRHLAVREHFICLASHEKPIDAAVSMRGHHNQVAAFISCCRDNAVCWMPVSHMNQIRR